MNAKRHFASQGNTTAQGQIAKANELLAEVAETNGEFANQVWADLKARWAEGTCHFEFVSGHISAMIEAKKASRHLVSVKDLPQVPNGRYAITGRDGTTDFYRVTRDKGTGHIKLFLYVSDDQRLVTPWQAIVSVLRRIEEAGIEAAATRWGLEMVKCHRCGAKLTDQGNPFRNQGLGPECGKKA